MLDPEIPLTKQQRAGLEYSLDIASREPFRLGASALRKQADEAKAAAALAYRFGLADIGQALDRRAHEARAKGWAMTETHE